MLTEFTRIAVSGSTIDGRIIDPNWLTQAAGNYDPALYTARINSDHISGLSADSAFPAYGDIVELKTEEITLNIDGKDEKRTALLARLEVNEKLLDINKKDQKVFSSIELAPDFAGKGTAYVVGMAVTDTPASLATERLSFNRNDPKAKEPANVASKPLDLDLKFSEASEGNNEIKGLANTIQAGIDKMTAIFASKPPEKTAEEIAAEKAAVEAAAGGNGGSDDAKFAALAEGITTIGTGISALSASITQRLDNSDKELAALKKLTEETPEGNHVFRKPATGNQGAGLIM